MDESTCLRRVIELYAGPTDEYCQETTVISTYDHMIKTQYNL